MRGNNHSFAIGITNLVMHSKTIEKVFLLLCQSPGFSNFIVWRSWKKGEVKFEEKQINYFVLSIVWGIWLLVIVNMFLASNKKNSPFTLCIFVSNHHPVHVQLYIFPFSCIWLTQFNSPSTLIATCCLIGFSY